MNLDATIEQTLAYHQRTKHHLHQYARSLGYLDWATQPDPFRTYAGVPQIELELLADRVTSSYGDLFHPGAIPPQSIGVETIGILFELSLGLSAWKQYQGSRWALRCNPSSGNLHPTEGYLIVPELPGLTGGVYHYVSRDHCLERPLFAESRGQCCSDRMPFPQSFPRRLVFDPLARGLEIRRTGLSVLPARRGTRHRLSPLRCGGAWAGLPGSSTHLATQTWQPYSDSTAMPTLPTWPPRTASIPTYFCW